MNKFLKSSKMAVRFFNRSFQLPVGYRQLCQLSWETHKSQRLLEGLIRSSTNYVPLTPISFLERATNVFSDTTFVVFGSSVKHTWEETHSRCTKLASALVHLGISRGDVVPLFFSSLNCFLKYVTTLAPNVPVMLELHYAVPMAQIVLCTLNTHHDSSTTVDLLKHSKAKIIFNSTPAIRDTYNIHEYENLLASGTSSFIVRWPKSEFYPISINYTFGTTSSSKRVVYSHRGAYLNAIATFLCHGMGLMPTYLWTVPMFHCNGWCMNWRVTAKHIFECISLYKVTHMSTVPTVLNMIANSPPNDRKPLLHKVKIMTGGSPPPAHLLLKMKQLGFRVYHGYGLKETYGAATSCVWKPEWDSLPLEEQAVVNARQGVQHLCIGKVEVRDPETMEKVPADGKTMGEIVLRGNTVMSGYLKDVKSTKEAFKGGWFHSGDVAVKHPNGYIEIKDQLKDIIISGGKNISTIEVERVLYRQTPCAFMKLKEGFEETTSDEIIKFCRDHLPHYMAPLAVLFEDLPKTSTGKVQRVILRVKAKALKY
ncbi:unnamed protein product [Withania somnifera]